MVKRKDFNSRIDEMKDKLDEQSQALISDDLLEFKAVYSGLYDKYKDLKKENETLSKEKSELLQVNGSLYQKVGFKKDEESETGVKLFLKEDKNEHVASVDDFIDKEGNLIV